MKTCPACNQTLCLDSFGTDRNRKDQKNVYCKACVMVSWHRRKHKMPKKKYNPEYSRNYRNNLNEEQKLKSSAQKRASFLRTRYGITPEQYDSMFASQDGKCAICERSIERKLMVDHNHINGIVRGLLCGPCNRFLGFIKADETARLAQNLLNYVKRDK